MAVKFDMMIKVKLIATEGAAAIIEYSTNGRIERAIVPNGAVKGNRISEQDLELGIPYGGIELKNYGISELLTVSLDNLQELLRQRGLWTEDDYLNNPQVILGVLQKLYGVDVTRILNAIKAGENDDDL
jgi:hypothetical protein